MDELAEVKRRMLEEELLRELNLLEERLQETKEGLQDLENTLDELDPW